MCAPTLALAAISGAQSIASINAQNDAAEANADAAIANQNSQSQSEIQKYIEQSRSIIQGGFDSVLQGRANEATAYSSAIENGVQGASIKHMLRQKQVETKRSLGRSKNERDSLEGQVGASLRHISSNTQGRINSVAPTGFGLGDAAGILTPIVKNQME